MPIPDYQTCMLPLLQFVSDGADYTAQQAVGALADKFKLGHSDRIELLPSGKQAVFHNRVGWARSYLKKAGLLNSPRRGIFCITDRGRGVLAEKLDRIDVKYLERFAEFVEFREASRIGGGSKNSEPPVAAEQTPEETLELAHQSLRQSLAQDILSRILSCSPMFFEKLVVDLLVKMGYGGSRRDAGERVGQSGDGGIDGIIKEDRLGLDAIYLQAKRWQGSVGRPEIQKFVGALQGQRARKGVFITTSTFTADAIDYASRIDTKVVLMNGTELAQLMIDFDVGVSLAASYLVKRIDTDFFEET